MNQEVGPVLSERALERRIKRQLKGQAQTFFAVCAPGFDDCLEQELRVLGLEISSAERGGVSFVAPLDAIYHSNLQLRTAHRVLLRLDDFLAQSYPMLFNKAQRLAWECYLGFAQDYSIRVSAKNSRLHQHKNIAKTLAAAIQKRLEPLGLRPEPKEDAVLEIHVRMFQDRCTISLNTSGEHLHKRGYRLLVGEAPLRETLAAGILLKADWSQHDFFYDPMCGSGTLLIEAALLASNKAPGLQRHFAFEQAPFFQPSKWERFKREAEAAGQKTERRFLGIDVDPDMIRIAKENAARAGVGDLIDFRLADARTFEVPTGYQKAKSPFVLSNLPYGERLESRDSLPDLLIAVSQQLSGQLKGNFALVCKDAAWLKDSGFALQDRQTFENGGLKVLLLQGMI